jgi:hypothetical protein
MALETYTIGKRKFLACDDSCADGFRTDRRLGLIYGSVRITPENRVVGWEEGSVECRFCAYCSAGEPDEPDGGERSAPIPNPVAFSSP